MTIKLTKKQQQILDYLREFQDTHEYSPTYREIMAALNIGSVSTIAERIDNLTNLGVIKKTPGAARSLELIDYKHTETVDLFKAKLAIANEEETKTLLSAAEILELDLS